MNFINPEIETYCAEHTDTEPALLSLINRETHANILMPRMLSGHAQGRLLSFISHVVKPTCILEIGTYTGYSALCLAEGLQKKGKLITVDCNEELENRVRTFFMQSHYKDSIDYRLGDAKAVIPTLNEAFDLVFIDADKENYALYYDLVFDKVKAGGVIIADNVLWSGKILQTKTDKDTRAIQLFNDKIKDDTRVEKIMLPFRDGLYFIRKK